MNFLCDGVDPSNFEIDYLGNLSRRTYMAADAEGLKEFMEAAQLLVERMLGCHEAYAKWLEQNDDAFNRLDDDKVIKTVLPKDLELVTSALESLNTMLLKLREGKPVSMSDAFDSQMEEAGLELKEDGQLHCDKFRCGNWGEGKGKTNLDKPLEFSKTVEEVNWKSKGSSLASSLVSIIRAINKQKMEDSINRFYRDIAKTANNKLEKHEQAADRRVVLNQTQNVLSIRNTLIKFVYQQISRVIKAAPRKKDEE